MMFKLLSFIMPIIIYLLSSLNTSTCCSSVGLDEVFACHPKLISTAKQCIFRVRLWRKETFSEVFEFLALKQEMLNSLIGMVTKRAQRLMHGFEFVKMCI